MDRLEPVFTITEISDHLRVHPTTVSGWLNCGYMNCVIIPPIKRNRKYKRSDLPVNRSLIRIKQSQYDEFMIKYASDYRPISKEIIKHSNLVDNDYKEGLYGDEISLSKNKVLKKREVK